MSRFAVVVPSKTLSNITECAKAISLNSSPGDVSLHIVNSGFDVYEFWNAFSCFELNFNVWVHAATSPFVFAQAVNTAVRASTEEVIIVMNDDAVLLTPGGLKTLAEAVMLNQDYGVVSSSVYGVACNGHILAPRIPYAFTDNVVRDAGKMVPFICVGFRRTVFNGLGGLDERFVDYGFEDDDFCRSARVHGLKIGFIKSVVVNHGSLPSTYRSIGHQVSLEPNRVRYIEKWGNHEGV